MCRYVSYEDKKLSGAKRQNEMVINRKKPHPSIPGQTVSVPYRVTDQPLKLNVQEWCVSVKCVECECKQGVVCGCEQCVECGCEQGVVCGCELCDLCGWCVCID